MEGPASSASRVSLRIIKKKKKKETKRGGISQADGGGAGVPG